MATQWGQQEEAKRSELFTIALVVANWMMMLKSDEPVDERYDLSVYAT